MDAPIEVLTTAERAARFWSNVDRSDPDGCWPWLRAVNGSGYGVNRCGANSVAYTTMAHRVAWMLANNVQLAPGDVLDHLCRTRSCCNPAHLERVTQSVNIRRGAKHLAGTAPIERIGPRTIRYRGERAVVIWREYLVDGNIRQAGRTFPASPAWSPSALAPVDAFVYRFLASAFPRPRVET